MGRYDELNAAHEKAEERERQAQERGQSDEAARRQAEREAEAQFRQQAQERTHPNSGERNPDDYWQPAINKGPEQRPEPERAAVRVSRDIELTPMGTTTRHHLTVEQAPRGEEEKAKERSSETPRTVGQELSDRHDGKEFTEAMQRFMAKASERENGGQELTQSLDKGRVRSPSDDF